MQKDNSSSKDDDFYTTTTTAEENIASCISATCGGAGETTSFFVNDLFLSPKDHGASFYSSLFSDPSTTPPSETSFDCSDANAAEHDLDEAGCLLRYQELYNRYTLCLAHLHECFKELEALRLENADLAQRLRLLCNFNRLAISSKSSTSPLSEPPPNDHDHNGERFSLPRSISVRSRDYHKLKPSNGGSERQNSTRHRANNSLSGSQRAHVPLTKRRDGEESLELEAYNQGMVKTELCNKWEETGACPYGDNCQFAHGVNELRPVIRHPRYKTQVCRMVLAGQPCSYGHRCHFRHSHTRQEI